VRTNRLLNYLAIFDAAFASDGNLCVCFLLETFLRGATRSNDEADEIVPVLMVK
jgi:hypothetical protein